MDAMEGTMGTLAAMSNGGRWIAQAEKRATAVERCEEEASKRAQQANHSGGATLGLRPARP